jgi:cell division protein FtsZ
MGTGYASGENRALEAAQGAITSPLLDDVSIAGAAGVLINITGGSDLSLEEVSTISSVIHEAAGDDAEIIFGAVHDPRMEGEVRVTVIATGFEMQEPRSPARSATEEARVLRPKFGAPRTPGRPVSAPHTETARPRRRVGYEDLRDLEIPTFIRRQMD